VRAYVLLLRSYRQNSAHTNHCIAKMLHRLAHGLGMEALLFQLSLFCLFNRLLSDPAAAAYKVREGLPARGVHGGGQGLPGGCTVSCEWFFLFLFKDLLLYFMYMSTL
jgi:hypothetical protein